MSVNQYEIGNEHPADQAMRAEQNSSPSATALTPEELAHYSRMNPADLVSSLANSGEAVPPDSPVRKMSSDQLRDGMRQAMGAIGDFRKAQSQVAHLEQLSAAVSANPTTQGLGDFLTASAEAGQASDQSQRSARRVGLRDHEYDLAVRQLAEIMDPGAAPQLATDPNASQPPADFASITQNQDGTLEVKLQTGEVFKGDPLKVINTMGKSYVHGKRWTQGIKAENEKLKNSQTSPPNGQPQPNGQSQQPNLNDPAAFNINAPQAALNSDIAEAFARSVGFSDAQEMISDYQRTQQQLQEMQSKLEAANKFASRYEDEQISQEFMAQNPDFPGDEHAIDTLVKIMDASDLDYSKSENLSLAHQFAVKRGFYRPLTPEGIRLANGEQVPTQSRTAPPQPPQGNAPTHDDIGNPWAMATDELRKRVLERGGLGRALLDMPAGSSLGGQ